jgi:hypothetical protein
MGVADYCIWHKAECKPAVALSGKRLVGLTKEDAELILGLIHHSVRDQVEIRELFPAWWDDQEN